MAICVICHAPHSVLDCPRAGSPTPEVDPMTVPVGVSSLSYSLSKSAGTKPTVLVEVWGRLRIHGDIQLVDEWKTETETQHVVTDSEGRLWLRLPFKQEKS